VSGSSRRGLNKGQYLAFFYAYTRLQRRAPAKADMQQYFCVTPPTVHQMVLTPERAGYIRRQPGVARSIKMLVDPEALPILLDPDQPITTFVSRF
jgi:DNA-binding MarR family transcriptional regulator